MDTTAAAELGGAVDGGGGFWDTSGVVEAGGGWTADGQGWGEDGGGRGRPAGAVNIEPPFKRMRNMSGDGYGNLNNPSAGFAPGGVTPDSGGIRGGYGGPPGTPNGDSGQGQGMARGRGMGSIFYKTKLCSRFRNGNCPYSTNCNFAHGMEELRRPPPGWEDVAVPQDGGSGGTGGGGGAGGGSVGSGGGVGAPNPPPGSGGGPSPNPGADMQRFHKTRPCKKYFSELGCPYGERCNFLHDEPNPQTPSKPVRENVVVTVATNGGTPSGSVTTPPSAQAGGGMTQRPPNWKTRLCNKWETTGNCPFGEKCHFAHGSAELQRYGGGPIDPSSSEGGASMQMDLKFGMNSSGNSFLDADEGLSSYPEGYSQASIVRQTSNTVLQQSSRHGQGSGTGLRSSAVWKGPADAISTIYGDWVEEDEWENLSAQVAKDPQPLGQSLLVSGHRATNSIYQASIPQEKEHSNASFSKSMHGGSQGTGHSSFAGNARGYAQGMQGNDMVYVEAGAGL